MITPVLFAIAAVAALIACVPNKRKAKPAAFVADVRPLVPATEVARLVVPSVGDSVNALQTLRLRLIAVGLAEEEIRQRLEPIAPLLMRELKQ